MIICLLFQMFGAKAQSILPPLKFKRGYATVSGVIQNDKPEKQLTLQVVVKSPFKEQPDFYPILIKKDGSFTLSVPMETNNALCSMAITGDEEPYILGLVGLSQTKPTILNVTAKSGKVIEHVSDVLELTSKERIAYGEAFVRFESAPSELTGTGASTYQWLLSDYVKWQMDSILPKRIHYALESYSFSPRLKGFLANTFAISYTSGRMFFYKQDALKHYNLTVQEPPLSYYSFMQRLNMNPEQALYESNNYPKFMARFLKVPAFGISPIGDIPVKTWIASVKNKIEKTIGIQTQSFYNILTLYAYLNDYKTLSPRQINNISAYYTGDNKSMGTALLEHYAQMDSLYNSNKNYLHINKTPKVIDSKILDAILSKYAGKTVLVDIWGTWCQPCLVAHKAMAAIKAGLRKKGVVFVYLADTSSPKQQWSDKIKEIGDEHYYLTRKQIGAIFANYKETSYPYPFYLIFDNKHKLKQKFAGFPGANAIAQALLR